MAWPKPCLVAIWHVLDLTYVRHSMVRLSLGDAWHGIWHLKWLQGRVMDEYSLVKGSQEVLANLHINVKLHIISYI